jgi:threonyl-tRNA synthetase
MFAILLEYYNGNKWPLWLSPRQAIVCSAKTVVVDHAEEVTGTFKKM